MKLYSGPLSLFTAKVRVALDEKGLDYERVEVGWSLKDRYLPHHPEVVRLNPRQQVPVLVDGDCVVCDSTVILEYLEDAYPEPPLRPGDAAGRARVRHWEAWADEVLFPQIWELIEGGFYPAASGEEAARFEAAKQKVALLHAVLDGQLAGRAGRAGREWIDDAFSVADIACIIMLTTGATLGAPPAAEHANLLGWLARASARPAIKTELAGMLAFVGSLGDRQTA